MKQNSAVIHRAIRADDHMARFCVGKLSGTETIFFDWQKEKSYVYESQRSYRPTGTACRSGGVSTTREQRERDGGYGDRHGCHRLKFLAGQQNRIARSIFCIVCRSKTVRGLHLTALLIFSGGTSPFSFKRDAFYNPYMNSMLGPFLYKKYYLAFE